MKSSEAAQLVFTVAGLIGILYGVFVFVGLISIFQFGLESPIQVILGVMSYLLPGAILVATGYFLIRQSKTIASRYFDGHDQASPVLNIRDIEKLAFSFLGLFVFLSALPKIANLAFGVFWIRWKQPEANQFLTQQLATYVGTLIQAVAGAYLFFYGPRFAQFWRRVVREPVQNQEPVKLACPSCGKSYSPADYGLDSPERRCIQCKNLLPEGSFEPAL